MTKPVWESKIFWLNLLATLTGVLDALKVFAIPHEYMLIGATVIAVVNVILRVWFTETSLTM